MDAALVTNQLQTSYTIAPTQPTGRTSHKRRCGSWKRLNVRLGTGMDRFRLLHCNC